MPGRTRRTEQPITAGMGPAYLTRSSQTTRLGELGVTGRAAEMALKLLAPVRHDARIQLAHKAAQDWAAQAIGADNPHMLHAICLIGALDQAGIGGTYGVTGGSTERHPAFAACGTGRKHARDGGAWDAAIAPLPMGAEFLPTKERSILVVVGGIAAAFPVGNRLVSAEWARSFAMQRLMESFHSSSLAAGWSGVANLADQLFDANIETETCVPYGVYTHEEWVRNLRDAANVTFMASAPAATRPVRPHRVA